MAQHNVVIVGGGFGGVKAALELSRDDRFGVTLISDREYFQYFPTLYRTATGGLNAQSQIPLKTIFAGKPVEVVIDAAASIDSRAKLITTKSGKKFEYDDAVFALGVVTNYFGIQGLEEFSFGMKSIEEIKELKDHIKAQLLDPKEPELRFVVVGGGPTGIELAGALPSYLHKMMQVNGIDAKRRKVRVDLVEGAPRLMPRMPKSTSRAIARRLKTLGVDLHLGKPVEGETAEGLNVGGKTIISNTVIWTAGMANSPFFRTNNFAFGPRGKVAVNVYLQADDNIYVIGDNANTPYSGMAQTALYDGEFVAKNLIRAQDRKDLRAYKPKKPVYVTPVGEGWAAAMWGKLEFFGMSGWLLRQAADARAFTALEPLTRAAKQWFTEFDEDLT